MTVDEVRDREDLAPLTAPAAGGCSPVGDPGDYPAAVGAGPNGSLRRLPDMESAFVTEFSGLEVREVNGQHELLFGICVPYNRRTTKAKRAARGCSAQGRSPAQCRRPRRSVSSTRTTSCAAARPVGVATALEERGDEGMFGRFRFYNTPEGRAALENTVEGTYGGLSVGFVAVREQEVERHPRDPRGAPASRLARRRAGLRRRPHSRRPRRRYAIRVLGELPSRARGAARRRRHADERSRAKNPRRCSDRWLA